MAGQPKTYSPKFKYQFVLEILTGECTPAQIARAYGLHPNSLGLWKKASIERGSEVSRAGLCSSDFGVSGWILWRPKATIQQTWATKTSGRTSPNTPASHICRRQSPAALIVRTVLV